MKTCRNSSSLIFFNSRSCSYLQLSHTKSAIDFLEITIVILITRIEYASNFQASGTAPDLWRAYKTSPGLLAGGEDLTSAFG